MGSACSAISIANYLLFLTEGVCEDMTNMKINKLLFFAQGHALQEGISLFDDDIRAGDHGPIVESVYHHYEKWGSSPIGEWDVAAAMSIPDNIKDLLIKVAVVYSQFTAAQLRWMTHQPHTPWEKHYVKGGRYQVIPRADIDAYFKNEVARLDDDFGSDIELVGYRDDQGTLVLPADMR